MVKNAPLHCMVYGIWRMVSVIPQPKPSQTRLDKVARQLLPPTSTQLRAMKFCTQVQLNLRIRVGQEKNIWSPNPLYSQTKSGPF